MTETHTTHAGDAVLTVRADAPIGTISPRLYGHFAEHIGRCCYDGLWVGNMDVSPAQPAQPTQQDGFRTDVVEALRALPVPLLRWPGGCYADHYHWRDGIGPVASRPRRLGMSCGFTVEDDNSLGTHEFLRLCVLLGAEPYLAGNVGTGSPQELCDWLEYCNQTLDTDLTRARRTNGASAPFNVPLWGVGNENWGCGGNYDPTTYAHEYRRYATMLRHVDATAELVTCGEEDAWNVELLAALGKHLGLVDHLSIHRYWFEGGSETAFTDDQYYHLLWQADETEQFVARTAAIIADATGGRQRIGIALDEWGVWHPEARRQGRDGIPPRQPVTFEQAGTMRDALAAGIALEGFHRQCNVLTMANLAQIVNILHAPVMTEAGGGRMWRTPTYHVLRLHAPHIGATALPVEIEVGDTVPGGFPTVSGTASTRGGGGDGGNSGTTAITVINRHLTREAQVTIRGIAGVGAPRAQLLTADSPRAQNSADAPDAVAPVPLPVGGDAATGWHIELPPHAIATLQFAPR